MGWFDRLPVLGTGKFSPWQKPCQTQLFSRLTQFPGFGRAAFKIFTCNNCEHAQLFFCPAGGERERPTVRLWDAASRTLLDKPGHRMRGPCTVL